MSILPARSVLLTLVLFQFFIFACKKSSSGKKTIAPITQLQKNKIDLLIKEISYSNNPSLQSQAFKELPSLLKDSSTRDYTIASIKSNLSHPVSSVASTNIGNTNIKVHGRKMERSNSTLPLKPKINKWVDYPPLERLKMILEFYYKDSMSEAQLNRDWKVIELAALLSKMSPYKKYYIAEYRFLRENLHKRLDTINTLPVTNFLKSYEAKLSQSIFFGKKLKAPITKIDTFSIVNCLSGKYYLANLIDSQPQPHILAGIREKIAVGDVLIPDQIFPLFRNQLLTLKDSQTKQLLSRYESDINSFVSLFKSHYLPNTPLNLVSLNLSDVSALEKESPGIYTTRFSYEFIYTFLLNYLNKNLPDKYLAEAIVKDAFKQFALANYAELVFTKERKFLPLGFFQHERDVFLFKADSFKFTKTLPTNLLIKQSQIKLKTIGALYRRGQVNEVIVQKRKFFLGENIVYEKGIVETIGGSRISYEYETQIPFNLINRIALNQSLFDNIHYSFFERELRIKYATNPPFFEFIDIIENFPIDCLPYIRNGINFHDQPIGITINEIRLNIASGHPRDLLKEIGLKIGYQKELDTSTSISTVLNTISKTKDITPYSDSLFLMSPSQLKGSTFNKISFDSLARFDSFQLYLKTLYAVSVEKQSHLQLYHLQQDRAIRLPVKADCNGCYDVFWCDKDLNRKRNTARQNAITGSQNGINFMNNQLARLSNVDILSTRNKTLLTSLGSVYDSSNKTFACYFQIVKDEKGCIFSLKFDSSAHETVEQIIKINKFLNQTDPYFLQRYSIDLTNLSTHGYEYFANLIDLFQKENTNFNSLTLRLIQEGFIQLHFNVFNFDIANANTDNSMTNHLILEHFMFQDEKTLIDHVNTHAELDSTGLTMLNDQITSIDQSLAVALKPDIDNINGTFDKADEEWNEWFVFVGYSSQNGITIPIIIYSGGSISINTLLRPFGTLPFIKIPDAIIPALGFHPI